jgi:hypothetical protein
MNAPPQKVHGMAESNVASLEDWRREHPKPLRGGGVPPMPPGKDFMSDMKSGTEFLCRDKMGYTPKWLVVEWIFAGLHHTGNVLLIPTKSANDPKTWIWVDPVEFCKAFDFRGIIEEPVDNGRSDILTEPEDLERDNINEKTTTLARGPTEEPSE